MRILTSSHTSHIPIPPTYGVRGIGKRDPLFTSVLIPLLQNLGLIGPLLVEPLRQQVRVHVCVFSNKSGTCSVICVFTPHYRFVHACTHTHMYTHAHTCTHTMHTHTHTHTHTHIHTHTHTHTHTRTHTHIHNEHRPMHTTGVYPHTTYPCSMPHGDSARVELSCWTDSFMNLGCQAVGSLSRQPWR